MKKVLIIGTILMMTGMVMGQYRGDIGEPGAGGGGSLVLTGSLTVGDYVQFTNLSGLASSVGDSMLVINSSGTLGKIPYVQSFFTSDGTANGNRSHDFNGNYLTIDNISTLILEANSSWTIRNADLDQYISTTDGIGIGMVANNGSEGLFFTSGGNTSITHGGNVTMNSTTGALILPRMTTTQRDALSPVAGMVIYNTTTGTFQGYSSSWNNL